VSRLRKELEPGRRKGEPPALLQTVQSGYRLAVEPDAVDAARFKRLAFAREFEERDQIPQAAARLALLLRRQGRPVEAAELALLSREHHVGRTGAAALVEPHAHRPGHIGVPVLTVSRGSRSSTRASSRSDPICSSITRTRRVQHQPNLDIPGRRIIANPESSTVCAARCGPAAHCRAWPTSTPSASAPAAGPTRA